MKKFLLVFCVSLLIFSSFAAVYSFADSDPVPADDFVADDTSFFTQLRSTIIHYIFGDDLTNVPFGSGWIDMICTILCVFLFLLPVIICFCAIKWVGRF